MSDQQKIWFIYLTDHHEGPFTAEEIAEKAKAGLVNGQSLAWKDGMPEWVAAETIPELASAMSTPAAPAAATGEAAPAAAESGDVSLAQLLANTQKTDGSSGQIADSASVLSSMVSNVHANSELTKGSVSIGSGTPAPMNVGEDPALDDAVWTLKVGGQVSGLHTLNKLREMGGAGEIPPDAMVWHPGWSDFQLFTSVPQLQGVRTEKGAAPKSKLPAGGGPTRTGITKPGVAISALSNNALDNDEESTDIGISAPAPSGFRGILFRIHKFVEDRKKKKKAAPAPAAASAAVGKTKAATAGTAKKPAAKAGDGRSRVVLAGGLLVLLLAGGGGAYFYLFSSPIPATVDVSEEDRESMVEVVKAKEGHRLFLALAKGTEENPADPATPRFFVASNFPEGTPISLTVTGVAGTLVNRLSFEKTYTANVEKGHVAKFEKIDDDGKPIWGEFNLKVTAEGAEPLDGGKRFIGTKGGAYQKRLKAYKDSIQGDYDKEITELREFITTLKNLQVEASKQIADYKTNWMVPANRTRISADWASFTKNSQALIAQLDANLKARQGTDKQPKYHARAFQDVGTTLGQLGQLVKVHGERLTGATPSGNADELDGLVQAGVQALEAWLAQAVAKTPFEGAQAAPDAGKPAPVPPAPVPAPAPAAAPAAAPSTPAAVAPVVPAPAPTPSPTAIAPAPTGANP